MLNRVLRKRRVSRPNGLLRFWPTVWAAFLMLPAMLALDAPEVGNLQSEQLSVSEQADGRFDVPFDGNNGGGEMTENQKALSRRIAMSPRERVLTCGDMASLSTKVIAIFGLMVLVAMGGNCMAEDAAAKVVAIPNPGLENNGEGWWVELGRGKLNSIEWLTEDAREGRTCAKLTYSGKAWLWLNTPPLLVLEPKREVTLAFQAKWLSGGNVFSVGCNSLNRADKSWGKAYDNLWVGELPKDNKWHELEIKFTTPDFDFKKRYVCIKMGPRFEATTTLIDDVRILSVAEAKPVADEEPFDASRACVVKFDLPDEISLDDFPDVSEITLDGKPWREVNLRDIRVRAPAKVEVRMGFHETLPLVVENKAPTKAIVEILPGKRMNVYAGTKSIEVQGGKAKATLGIQTLRAVDFDLVLKVISSGLEKSLPVRIEPEVTYPVFGLVEHFMRCPPRSPGSFLEPKTNAKAEGDMKYMRLLPCQVFRVDGPGCWSTVERKKGEYFFDAADWHIAATRKFGGSRSVMLLGYQPVWANPFFDVKEEEKLAHWREYVRAVVRRYRDQVDYWEVNNEPYGFWFGGWGKRKKLYKKDYAEECSPILGAVIKIASEVIRQEDSDGKILTPGFIPSAKEAGQDAYRMMEKLFEMGMGEWVDFINLHIYPASFHPIPTTPAQGYKVDGKEVVSWEATLLRWRQFDKKITMRDLLELMKKYGVNKPLWITEFGGHPAVHERAQGLGILRQAAVLVSEGANGLHYYEFYDYPHEPSRYQLVRHEDKYRTLGLVAYSQAIRYLTGASYEPERCEVRRGETAEENLPYRVFGRGKETIICLWSNAAKQVDIEIRTKEEFASAHVITFSSQGKFLTETELSLKEKAADDTTRLVSDQQLVTRVNTLQFKILSLKP